jgi:molecular chaperone HtpG
MSTHQFQTEVNQLLHLIIHSLYSNKEIFLRELVSNASDALDKLKFLTYTDEKLRGMSFDPRIDISFSEEEKTLTITDTGIGMNEQDLVENLGTIARSGTRNFIETLKGDNKGDINMIGQFGVGFYSAFMVADRVRVISRKAGEEAAWAWESEGRGEYSIENGQRETQGTTVIIHLNEDGKEFAGRWAVERVIKKYSNHIPFPIYLHYDEIKHEGEGKDRKQTRERKIEKINEATALWRRPKSDLKEEDYREFYKVISHGSDEPILHIHTQAEGTMDYTTLFYIPGKAPFDLYLSDFKSGVKLYVKRVFITDEDRDLLPTYLRFIRGVIDSEDLPLNVSREILQQNRILAKIKTASVKKILGEIQKLAGDAGKYADFYREFGKPIKEGLYQDYENRETLLELVRFKSTTTRKGEFTSLAEYKGRLKPDQKVIYYVTGESEDTLRQSPLLEMYRDKGIEVLIMDDEIDEIIIPSIGVYDKLEFKSVNRSDAADELKTEEDRGREKELDPFIARLKEILKDRVKDVKASTRLSDSPSCIVVDQADPTVKMQSILKAMGKFDFGDIKPVLEINPRHEIIRRLQKIEDQSILEDASIILLEQAMLIEGIKIENPATFVQRLNRLMERAL